MPVDSASVADLMRLTETDIAGFESQMRTRDPVSLRDARQLLRRDVRGEKLHPDSMPGYWLLRSGRKPLFLPLDLEELLSPTA